MVFFFLKKNMLINFLIAFSFPLFFFSHWVFVVARLLSSCEVAVLLSFWVLSFRCGASFLLLWIMGSRAMGSVLWCRLSCPWHVEIFQTEKLTHVPLSGRFLTTGLWCPTWTCKHCRLICSSWTDASGICNKLIVFIRLGLLGGFVSFPWFTVWICLQITCLFCLFLATWLAELVQPGIEPLPLWKQSELLTVTALHYIYHWWIFGLLLV